MIPASFQSPAIVSQCKDLLRCLPPHLSLYILGFLDQNSLKACAEVSRCWAFLAREVSRERVCQSAVQEKILYLQGLSPRGADPNYTRTVHVTVPQLNEEGDAIELEDHGSESKEKGTENSLQAAYCDLKTNTIQLEERNVFCGSYNIHVLMDQPDQNRVIHYSGGNLLAVGSADRKVRLLEVLGVKEVPLMFSGHAGSIKALCLNEKKGFVLSASFDLSIRCWNIHSGACVKVFTGHCGTITCLDLHEEQFVSGARDGMVKVWNVKSGECLKTLKHCSAVWVVKTDGTYVVSGCSQGLVKVWRGDTGALIKKLEGHQGPIKCLSFDQWHLVTGSTDGYALGWSMLGNLKRCLMAFRHPKEVLCLEFLYLRVISSCADGKIRIFNYLTGTCLKVLMASSRGDPISSFCVAGNRMVINSPTSLLMFQFKDVRWDNPLDTDGEMLGKDQQCKGTAALHYELKQTAAGQPQQIVFIKEKSFHTEVEQREELFIPDTTQSSAFASGRLVRAGSIRTLVDTEGRSEEGPSLCEPAHPDTAATPLQPKKRSSSCPVSPDKLLLMVSTLQNARKAATVSSSIKSTAEVMGAHQPPRELRHHCTGKVQPHNPTLPHKKAQTVLLQHTRLHSEYLNMRRVSMPLETKILQQKLKSTLHGPAMKSSIATPSILCPKTCCIMLQGKEAHSGHKVIPHHEDGVQILNPFRPSSEQIKPSRLENSSFQEKKGLLSVCYRPFLQGQWVQASDRKAEGGERDGCCSSLVGTRGKAQRR